MTDKGKLTPKQARAIAELLQGKTNKQAAAAVGVTRQTMTRWLAEPTFRKVLADEEGQLLSELNRQLFLLSNAAIFNLATVLDKPDDQRVSLRASDIVLSKLLSIRELSEIEQRLIALEQTVNRGNDEPKL